MAIEPNYTVLTQQFVQEVCAANEGMDISVILIGSVARSTQTSQSDLDLLVVGAEPPRVERHADRLHVQALTTKQIFERLRAGDDFAAWCVRYGVPLRTSNEWLQIAKSSEASAWPDWHKKIRHAARRLTLANSLLDTDDLAAATEEMMYAVSHTGRAILLKADVFPLSRPEMISQLLEIGQRSLAALLQDLSYGQPTRALLKRSMLYVKRLLVHLDKTMYQEFASLRREQLVAKRTRLGARESSRNGSGRRSSRVATP